MTIERTVLVLAWAGTLLAMSSWPAPAAAQWMWKDEAGHTIASDQPPPVGTPESRILKQPRPRTLAATPAAAPVVESAPGKTLADRELESRQRQKDAAEATKKSDDEAAKARAMQDNCSAVRGNLAALQAGGRAARFNEKGEKVYIDDTERQAEIARSQGQVAQFCR